MKAVKIVAIICVLLIICSLLLSLPVSAHSGRTDSKGGHYNRDTGEYHYHHGQPAHQHPNGVCPYSNSNNSSNSNSSNKDESETNSVGIIIGIIIGVPVLCVCGPLLYVYIENKIKNRKNDK